MHSLKELMAEIENLRTEKVSQEESSKLAKKKFQDELVQLKAQMESLQSQVRSENDKTMFALGIFEFRFKSSENSVKKEKYSCEKISAWSIIKPVL